jgi:hypothetical protein
LPISKILGAYFAAGAPGWSTLSSFGFLVLSCFGLVIDYITKENNYIKISLYIKSI